MVQTGVGKLTPEDVPIPDIDDESALLELEASGHRDSCAIRLR